VNDDHRARQEKESTAPGKGVLKAALSALQNFEQNWNAGAVDSWSDMVLARPGRVVLTGMGKSGLIAQKIAATFASTGCPSFFLHPAEALHGDLGMVTGQDTVLALSNSGESEEVVRLLPSLLRMDIPIAAITAKPESSLGQAAKWQFTYELPSGEGCPLDLAPMASTTLQLVWGDLLAACLMERRGFTRDSFAANHPAGSLGAKFVKVKSLMHQEWPRLSPDASFTEVLKGISGGRLGMATVETPQGLLGVITDGDIRRGIEGVERSARNPLDLQAKDLMNANPATTDHEQLAIEAAAVMESRKITFLIALEKGRPVGVLHIHDLLTHKVL
jgi:arabinose-5-phosphate isomerase